MPILWSGERTEVDVLSLLWLGISSPKGFPFPDHQLSEKRKETLGGISRRRPEIASSISYWNGLKNGGRILITLTH
jgi:hypothetical protein